jgi:PAS domain S-box-containing protein
MTGDFHKKLIEEFSDIATIIDAEGTITYVSPSVQHTLGYDPEALVGETGYEYQHPDDRGVVAAAIETLQANPDDVQVVETRFRHADGSWCWIEATIQNRLDDDDIDGFLVSSRDISERKRRERQFQSLTREYQTLLETVEDGIFFLSVEPTESGHVFQFERLNRAYEEQTGITTEEVRGKTPTEVFGDELGTDLQANYRRCVSAREPITYQEEVPVETGAQFWQTSLAPVVTDGDVTEIIGITRDITERVERERQLQSQTERLDEFASVVSHDLRNPLNVAQGRAELLAGESESEHLDPIIQSLDRMEAIVSDTLTLAREGQTVAEQEAVELVNLVGACWKTVSTGEATLEIEDDITIRGDRGRLRHVFENLFRNSVEHGSTSSRPEADDAVEHGGENVTIRVGRIDDSGIYVEDTGPGIPEDARDAVFEPGHTSASDGTGFGLTIVRRVAEAHGWSVEVVDGADGGARFEFTGVTIAQD